MYFFFLSQGSSYTFYLLFSSPTLYQLVYVLVIYIFHIVMCRTGTHRTRRRWEVVGEGGIVSRCYRLITKPGCLLHRMSSGSRSTSSRRGNEIHRLFHFCPTYCVCPSASLPQLPKKHGRSTVRLKETTDSLRVVKMNGQHPRRQFFYFC